MRASLTSKAFLLAAALSAAFGHAAARSPRAAQPDAVAAQEPALKLQSADVARGKKLLEDGDVEGALKVLREAADKDKDDDAAWHYLGVALARAGRNDEALKASERALEVRSRVFNFELSTQRNAGGGGTGARDSATRRALFKAKAAALAESIEAYVALGPEDAGLWREWLTTMRLYAQAAADPRFDTEPFRLADFMTRAVILRKPEPTYTERARRGRISGLVRLRVVLGADGKVGGVSVIKGLGGGLSESAVSAARGIRFTPATVKGVPASQLVVVEYNFHVF